jgi:hypothetical protein
MNHTTSLLFFGTTNKPTWKLIPTQRATAVLHSPGPSCIMVQSQDLAESGQSQHLHNAYEQVRRAKTCELLEHWEDSEVPTIKLHPSFSHVLLRFPSPVENGAVPTAMIVPIGVLSFWLKLKDWNMLISNCGKKEHSQTWCRERPGVGSLDTPGTVSIASQRASPDQKLWMFKIN